jgi:hypothetical protein
MDADIVAILLVVVAVSAMLGIIPCWMLSSKGYDGSALIGMFLLSFFCSWPIAFCVALIMPPRPSTTQNVPRHRPHSRPPMPGRGRRPELRQAAQFVTCNRCGQQNNASLSTCWNCDLSLHGDPEPIHGWAVPPRTVAVSPAATRARVPTPARDPHSDDPHATPLLEHSSAPSLGSRLIKVRCKACQKKFSGTVALIAGLHACPNCNANPFDSESAE